MLSVCVTFRLPSWLYVCACFIGCSRGVGLPVSGGVGLPFSGFYGFLGWSPCVGHFGNESVDQVHTKNKRHTPVIV